jgi:uncharacterized Zn finger protein (UPF0148 family)
MEKYGVSCVLCDAPLQQDADGQPYCPTHGHRGGETPEVTARLDRACRPIEKGEVFTSGPSLEDIVDDDA